MNAQRSGAGQNHKVAENVLVILRIAKNYIGRASVVSIDDKR